MTHLYSTRGAAIEALVVEFGDRILQSASTREHFSSGQGTRCTTLPDAVFAPSSTQEVAQVVRLCAHHRVPIIPYGVGTSLEGQVDTIAGGLTVDLSRMDRILAVNNDDLDVHVEAGVTREALNSHLRDQGLFFPLDPGANATLGGMAATRASGTNAVRYGTMREVTLGLTVVTPQGEIIHTGGRARKSSTGLDLTRLYVGSEGTLGLITELRLRVFGIPELTIAGVAQFSDTSSAINFVVATLQMAIPIARLEFLDELQMRASIAYSKLEHLLPAPTLFIELHGSSAAVAEQRKEVEELCNLFAGEAPRWAERQEDRSYLWKGRHEAYWAARALKPGFDAIVTDSCVPISLLAKAIEETQADAADSNLICPMIGHVGDGNFHVMILYDAQQRAVAQQLAEKIARRAIRLGGTMSGEHGVGHLRMDLLREEHRDAIATMQTIKSALDPLNIMNPGKMLPPLPV